MQIECGLDKIYGDKMKNILVLGAGKSSPYLISYLLDCAEKYNWFVTVGDLDKDLASSRLQGHSHSNAIFFDVTDSELRSKQIEKADVVINVLAPRFQHLVALTCVRFGKHMISVSYQDQRIREIERDAQRKGVLVLTEIGLDPGIDHMSAAELVHRIREKGGIVKNFQSYGGGLPAPDTLDNPMKYVISWNPRNVVMAGQNGAQYLENVKIKIIPFHNVFQHTWTIDVPGIGMMEAYPNRDSLYYQKQYGFEKANTVIRGTIRYPGFSETWFYLVRLGLPNETLTIPNLANKSYAELTEMFLPADTISGDLEQRVANFLNISPTGQIMEKMRWLGLFSEEKIGGKIETAAEVMTHLLSRKLELNDETRDMVILQPKIDVDYPDSQNQSERIISTMINYGEEKNNTNIFGIVFGY